MSDSEAHANDAMQPETGAGMFQAMVNQQPFTVRSVLARLTLRPELWKPPSRWIWKIIAEGKVGRKWTSIGLFFDTEITPGTYDLIDNQQIKVIYNETPHWKNVIYHSAHFQAGQFTLLEAHPPTRHLKGRFGFSISAIGFEVTDGQFDLHYQAL